MEERKKSILILGIGNLLFKDEGVGIHVAEKMSKMDLPPDVEVMDGGMKAPIFMYIIEGRKKVIVIDAMQRGGPPGSIYRFSEKEYDEKRKGFPRTTQESEFDDALKTTYLMKTTPDEVVFIGVEPEDMGEKDLKLNIGLSPTLKKKMPEIIEAVMREIIH